MMVDGMWIAAFGSKPAEEVAVVSKKTKKRKAPSTEGMPITSLTLSKLFNVPQYIKCSAPPLERIHDKILYMLDACTPQIINTS